MTKRVLTISLVAMVAILLLCGCIGHTIDTALPDTDENGEIDSEESFEASPLSIGAVPFADVDELLSTIAVAKFGESMWFEYLNPSGYALLREIDALYMPLRVMEGYQLDWIHVKPPGPYWYDDAIMFLYSGYLNFLWTRVPMSNRDFQMPEDLHEDLKFYYFDWSQHGFAFSATIPAWARFTEEEIYSFCDAQPVIAWELQGDAVSVVIQGMERVSIFDEDGNELASRPSDYHRLAVDIGLAILCQGDDEGSARVGYRWLIDDGTASDQFWYDPGAFLVSEESSRYQYVLEPGDYTFRAEGIIGEQDLVISHFANGELVSSMHHGEKFVGLAVSEFSVTVTPGPGGSTVTFY